LIAAVFVNRERGAHAMEPFGIGITGLGAAGAATLGAFGLAFRSRRRRLSAQSSETAIAAAAGPGTGPEQIQHDRIEAIATAQAELALRLDALAAAGSAPEERLQAMAGQLLGLIRDKNATLETAMTGLDQLRARMKALEEMGEPAEARGLFEGLKARMGELETRAAAGAAGLEARLAALASGGGASELAERLARLHEARDAGLEAALGRLAPLETRLAGLESGIGAGREATRRLEAALAALQGEQAQARTEMAALRATAETAPIRTEARVEAVRAELSERIEAFERAVAGRDPQAALDRLAERIEAVQDRLVLLETAENPLAEVSERLAQLHAQKDAAVETVLARLGPLEARLGAFEREIAVQDPQGALDRFAERLEAMQGRVSLLETAEAPLAEISEKLGQLYAQKDAAVEAVLARLGPLEARLGDFEREIAAKDPRAAIEQLAARVEAVAGRVSLVETAESPLAELSERLAQLHAQKDAAVETVLVRLGPLEARLGAFEREIALRDPQGALDRFAERLEGVAGRLATVEAAPAPLAEVTETLGQLYAQKEAAVEAVLARLGPLEARLGAFEREVAAQDPQGALDRFAERLEGVAGRLATVESAPGPLVEVSERLAELHAGKEAAVEAVLVRLGPLEAKIAAVEGGLARLDADESRAAIEGLRARIETLQGGLGEASAGLAALRAEAAAGGGIAEAADRLARLFAGKDDAIAAVQTRLGPLEAGLARLAGLETLPERLGPLEAALERLGPLEAALGRLGSLEAAAARLGPLEATVERLAALEATLGRLGPLEARLVALEGRDDPEAARAMAGEVAAELAALRADAAAQTALFADRLALLEASLPRPDLRAAAARRAAEAAGDPGVPGDGPADPATEPEEAIWALPRVISLHT
jgi:phage shock protein A